MKRSKLPNDPLHGKNGTVRMHYKVITETGISIECQTRSFRMDLAKYEKLEAFIKELYDGTPEIKR